MEVDKVIEAVEKYLREFVLFLVEFFWHGRGSKARDPQIESLNRSMTFALLSAAMGAYLWDRHFGVGKSDTLGILVDDLLRWISLGVLLYGLLRLCRVHVHILIPVILVVKVFAVAHVLGIYVGYLAKSTANYVAPDCLTVTAIRRAGVVFGYGTELVILLLYLHREMPTVLPGSVSARRRAAIELPFLLVMAAVVAVPGVRWWHIADVAEAKRDAWRAENGPLPDDPKRDDTQLLSLCKWVKKPVTGPVAGVAAKAAPVAAKAVPVPVPARLPAPLPAPVAAPAPAPAPALAASAVVN